MPTRVRRFLLLLLMLALPVQAFASAAMMSCALPQQDTVQTMVMADEMMAGCHEPEPSAPAASHDCKHCTACALASALPIPSSDTPAIMSLPTRYIPHAAASFSGFVPEGPERPPRSTLV